LPVARISHERIEIAEILPAGASSMIADPPGQNGKDSICVVSKPVADIVGGLAEAGVVLRHAASDDVRTVEPDPDVSIGAEIAFLCIRPAMQVSRVAGLAQDLDQSPGMAKGIEIHRDARLDSEFGLEVAAALKNLPHKRLTRRHIAVGLEIPPAHDVPFPGRDKAPDSLEEQRVVFFGPFIEQRLVVVEDEDIEFLAQISRSPEGGQCCRSAFLTFSQPHGVEVGVADKMEPFGGHVSSSAVEGVWLSPGPPAAPG